MKVTEDHKETVKRFLFHIYDSRGYIVVDREKVPWDDVDVLFSQWAEIEEAEEEA